MGLRQVPERHLRACRGSAARRARTGADGQGKSAPGDDEIVSIAGAPAPAPIATQMYNQATLTKMIAKFTQGNEPMERVIAWAASELEGFMRA